MKRFLTILTAIAITAGVGALGVGNAVAGSCGSATAHTHEKADAHGHDKANMHQAGYTDDHAAKADIVDLAIGAGSFKTLTAALQAAGLVDVLRGDGPFTVFAPTDEAFAKLPKGTVESLLEPENKDKLTAVLTYHVVPGALDAEDVASRRTLKTVNGQKIELAETKSGLKLDESGLVKTDLFASNGVVHVIDTVLLPQ